MRTLYLYSASSIVRKSSWLRGEARSIPYTSAPIPHSLQSACCTGVTVGKVAEGIAAACSSSDQATDVAADAVESFRAAGRQRERAKLMSAEKLALLSTLYRDSIKAHGDDGCRTWILVAFKQHFRRFNLLQPQVV